MLKLIHWDVDINPDKTYVILKSSRSRAIADFEIRFGNTSIEPSPVVKVLGMSIDSGLTFESHISSVIRRCYATLGGLSKMTRKLPERVKR